MTKPTGKKGTKRAKQKLSAVTKITQQKERMVLRKLPREVRRSIWKNSFDPVLKDDHWTSLPGIIYAIGDIQLYNEMKGFSPTFSGATDKTLGVTASYELNTANKEAFKKMSFARMMQIKNLKIIVPRPKVKG